VEEELNLTVAAISGRVTERFFTFNRGHKPGEPALKDWGSFRLEKELTAFASWSWDETKHKAIYARFQIAQEQLPFIHLIGQS